MINDVVATLDGGFLVTHMMTKSDNEMATFGEYIKGNLLGSDTGYVISWNLTDGFGQLVNSGGIVSNGIQISDDGKTVFVNYSNGELRRINRLTGNIEASNDTLPPLDNATWTPDGRLLLAGGSQNPVDMVAIMMNCTNLEAGTCPANHVILSADPHTLEAEIIYEGGAGTPGGTDNVATMSELASFLLSFLSNVFVDPATMPEFLRVFVNLNPISLTATSMRGLLQGNIVFGDTILLRLCLRVPS